MHVFLSNDAQYRKTTLLVGGHWAATEVATGRPLGGHWAARLLPHVQYFSAGVPPLCQVLLMQCLLHSQTFTAHGVSKILRMRA